MHARIVPFPGADLPNLTALERFAWALLDLTRCSRCIVGFRPKCDDTILDHVGIGLGAEKVDDASLGAWFRCREEQAFGPITALDAKMGSILARDAPDGGHAVSGLIPWGSSGDIVFISGWRPEAATAREVEVLAHELAVFSKSIARTVGRRLEGQNPLDAMDLAVPAFGVDKALSLCFANERGRRYLGMPDGVLKVTGGGALAGSNAIVSTALKRAVARVLDPCDEPVAQTTVALNGVQAFAVVSPLSAFHQASRALILIPQWEATATASRIGRLCNLPPSDAKLIANLLQGFSMSEISSRAGLTESTVRTYTKRLMLKLGIKRQLDLFRLAALISAPMGGESLEPVSLPPTPFPAA